MLKKIMNKARRHLRYEQVKAEEMSQNIPSVGINSYVSLFDDGFETVVLFDFKTDIHPSMWHIFLPGLERAKRDFFKAYAEVLLRRQNDKIMFAIIDHFSEDHCPESSDSNVLSLIHKRAQIIKPQKALASDKQLGEIRIISAQKGILVALPIKDVTDSVDSLMKMALPSYEKTEFQRKIRDVSGPEAKGLGSIICALERCGCGFPMRQEIDFLSGWHPTF